MLNKNKNIAIIGSGFSGLSAACYLGKAGYQVTVLEKNEQIGGRARLLEIDGFQFDMGPSWYWMPDVFENFFSDFDKKVEDYYDLVKLSPGFQVIFSPQDTFRVEREFEEIIRSFEQIEKGSGAKLDSFIQSAAAKYQLSMKDLVFKPCLRWTEFIRWDILKNFFRFDLFSPLSVEVRKLFQDERLRKIVEFPVIFLGAMADKIPALYSIMNYAALKQGTFYPKGGMVQIIYAMHHLAVELGVHFQTNVSVEKIEVNDGKVTGVIVNGELKHFDAVISAADYHHTEMQLLDEKYRNYNEQYWASRTFAPSSVIFYLGLDKKIDKLQHHNLFFDTDFEAHAKDIYEYPRWTEHPLFYTCCPSKTDESVAPEGKENLFILIPYAIQLDENEDQIAYYYQEVMSRLEAYCGEDIRSSVIVKRSYSGKNFKMDYHSYRGNAYGLANTLLQTAFLKPSIRNKKLDNLFYTGQLTVPGPGVPPAIISGKIVANQMINYLKSMS